MNIMDLRIMRAIFLVGLIVVLTAEWSAGQQIRISYGNPYRRYSIRRQQIQPKTSSYASLLMSYLSRLQQNNQQTFQQPVQQQPVIYQTPATQSVQQPVVITYQQPAVSTFQQPAVSTFQQPAVSVYQQPAAAPAQLPAVNTYQQPITSFQQSSYYSNPQQQQQTFSASPVQSFSYQEPLMPVSTGFQQSPQSYQNFAPQQQQQQQQSIYQPQMQMMSRGYSNQGQQMQMMSRGYGNQGQQMQGYGSQRMKGYGNSDQSKGYGKQEKKKKTKKIYIPVPVKKKKKEKMKIVSVMPGFYVAGGTQIFGKYKSLKKCQKACGATPSCFAGDYNPWLNKCYLHTNFTACSSLRAHKKLIHFKKVTCEVPEAPEGLVTLGAQLFKGVEQQGIKSLSDCIKRCANAGTGIPASVTNINEQLCFGIDYDFGSHKCYFHVNNENFRICPADGTTPLTPRDLVANPAVINILLCPGLPV